MTARTPAEELVQVLRRSGVDRVYGVAAQALEPIADAIWRTDGIEWTEVQDERAGVVAAADDAQASGGLAVCAGTYGAGSSRLLRGLRDAQQRGEPVLALAAQMSSVRTGVAPLREIHPERLFIECSHYCGIVSDASQLPQLARAAMQHALVRQGVSVLLLDPPTITRRPAERPEPCRVREGGIRIARQVVRTRGLPLQVASAAHRHRHPHS
ncbi:MAG TPA: thiamine pyrophosphate-binding protein [Solirubrobacteraceae bacterium]|nr:thiamine pyrophosphate-binding protein [Solirubrobacteraceae bacterium]